MKGLIENLKKSTDEELDGYWRITKNRLTELTKRTLALFDLENTDENYIMFREAVRKEIGDRWENEIDTLLKQTTVAH